MEQRLSLITLGVADVARSRRFYEALGWRTSSASQPDEVAFFQLGGIALALWGRAELAQDAEVPDSSGFGGMALAHNARTRAEVDAILEEVRTAGARILRPARETSWGGYAGYFADPDGHPWEVAWNPHFPLRADGSLELPVAGDSRRSSDRGKTRRGAAKCSSSNGRPEAPRSRPVLSSRHGSTSGPSKDSRAQPPEGT